MDDSIETDTGVAAATLARRAFLARAGATTGALVASGVVGAVMAPATALAAVSTEQRYVGTSLEFELDGSRAAIVTAARGGEPFLEPVIASAGQVVGTNRHQEPLRMSVTGITKPLADWITGATTGKASAVAAGAALVARDASRRETYRLWMQNALLTEVMLDGVDATSDEPALFDLLIAPSVSGHQFAGGGAAAAPISVKQKAVRKGNFAFFIQGLEPATTMVRTIDRFGARRNRDGSWSPTPLKLELPLAHAGPLYAWMDETLRGSGQRSERPGVLQLLDPTLKIVLASLEYQGLVITRIGGPVTGGSQDALQRVSVDLYGRGLTFNLNGLT